MQVFKIERSAAIRLTVQNMIEAGVVIPSEARMFAEQLWRLNPKDLKAALLDSITLRESESERIKFYPIDMDAISNN